MVANGMCRVHGRASFLSTTDAVYDLFMMAGTDVSR